MNGSTFGEQVKGGKNARVSQWTEREGQMTNEGPHSNVNVMLPPAPDTPATFPCPLCAASLELRRSRAQKPYCVCNSCGIQLFFRGKTAISKLKQLAGPHHTVRAVPGVARSAVLLYGQLEQLRAQKKDLEGKRPFLSRDHDLEHAIAAIEAEIAGAQIALEAVAVQNKS